MCFAYFARFAHFAYVAFFACFGCFAYFAIAVSIRVSPWSVARLPPVSGNARLKGSESRFSVSLFNDVSQSSVAESNHRCSSSVSATGHSHRAHPRYGGDCEVIAGVEQRRGATRSIATASGVRATRRLLLARWASVEASGAVQTPTSSQASSFFGARSATFDATIGSAKRINMWSFATVSQEKDRIAANGGVDEGLPLPFCAEAEAFKEDLLVREASRSM